MLVDEGDLDLTATHWPLPIGAVLDALARLPAHLSIKLERARSDLFMELEVSRRAEVAAVVGSRGQSLPGFGDDALPGSSGSLRTPGFESPWLAAQLGIRVERSSPGSPRGEDLRLEGSAVALEALGIQLQGWSHRNWWGPGWQSSLILGSNASSINAVGIQRASASRSPSAWLAWLGPWSFEFFVGQLQGVTVPAHPFLVGNRLTVRPLSWLEIGLTRTAQWGGKGRPQSLSSFGRMLAGGGVNADTSAEAKNDPANELAGFDFRLRCPLSLPCAGYAQAIGEDQAGLLPSHYLGLYGMELWSNDGYGRWFWEYAETGCHTPIGRAPLRGCAYRNYAYPGGYVQDGRWLGASVGPDSRLLTVGWFDTRTESSVRLQYGSVGSRIGTFSATDADPSSSGHLIGLSAKRVFHWHSVFIEPGLSLLQINAPDGRHHQGQVHIDVRKSFGK